MFQVKPERLTAALGYIDIYCSYQQLGVTL